MQKKRSMNIIEIDFNSEHSLVTVTANRSCPEIKLVGLSVGPFEEGNDYEMQFWIAKELEKAGIVRFREEERFDLAKLSKIQWMERVQTSGQITRLPENFYPKIRRYFKESKEAAKSPEKMREYEKIRHLVQDIVNARLKKIISLASAPTQTEQILKNLSDEERFLYEKLRKLVHDWRTEVLNYEGVKE